MAKLLKITVLIFVLMLIGLQHRLWVGDGGISEYMRLKHDLAKNQIVLQATMDKNQMLEAEVQDLKHHLSALEERARYDLGMIRRGEIFYQHGH